MHAAVGAQPDRLGHVVIEVPAARAQVGGVQAGYGEDRAPGSAGEVMLWVDPDERGRGVGGALYVAASEHLRRIGSVAMRTDVPEDDAGALGFAARFVSGYALIDGEHRPTPHGWAEAFVDGVGWIAFDPCTGRSPEEDYVRVSAALDAAGAAPVAGSRLGEGNEELDVDVSVSLASS